MDVKKQLEAIEEMEAANERNVEEFKRKQEKLLAVYVDVYGKGDVRKVRIHRDLEEYYRLLKCTTVDMPTRWIGGKPFIVICDDEGLFRADRRVSALDGREVMFVGNLLIVAFDGAEDIRGLTDEEAAHVMKRVGGIGTMTPNGGIQIWQVLKGVKYRKEG